MKVNNEEENAELMNEVVDEMLKKLLSDKRILEELKESFDEGYAILKAYEKWLQE